MGGAVVYSDRVRRITRRKDPVLGGPEVRASRDYLIESIAMADDSEEYSVGTCTKMSCKFKYIPLESFFTPPVPLGD